MDIRDFSKITACGESCVDCSKKEEGFCQGCIETDGKCKEWEQSGGCPIYKCTKRHNVKFCGLCTEFPCEWLLSKITWKQNVVEELSILAKEYKLFYETDRNNISNVRTISDGMSPAEVMFCEYKGQNAYIKSISKEYFGTTYSVKREKDIMLWLKDKLYVPDVLGFEETENKETLLMTEIIGIYIDDFQNDMEKYVWHLSNAVKLMWSVDIADCSFNSRLNVRLDELKYLLDNNLADVNTDNWEDTTVFNNPCELYDWLVENKPSEELVFSHGDISANIFVNGTDYYFYDLARAGIADKWLDIAFCVRDIRDVCKGKKYEELFFDLLEIKPDYTKIDYYILLDEMF